MTTDKLPKALVSGSLPMAGINLNCAVLDDVANTRVIGMTSVFKAFDRVARSNARMINRPSFMDAQSLQPFISEDLERLIKPIEYLDGGKVCKGYNSLILPELCDMYLSARRAGALVEKQKPLAEKAEILQTALAKVGMIALIDEATGFQFNRKYDALRMLLAQYVSDGMQKWIKRFPDKFFEELDKLYGKEKTTSRSRPPYYGKFINEYVYKPIEDGFVKSELDKKNIGNDGKRKGRFHQWLSDFGANQLTIQIGRAMGVMEISPTLRKFKENISRQKGLSIQPDLFKNDED
jgi:hypothetical protein